MKAIIISVLAISSLNACNNNSTESASAENQIFVKGPAYREHKLPAGKTDIIREVFYAAEPAQLSVKTRQGAVTLRVKADDAEILECHMEANSQARSCSWTPLYTTPHEIMLTNTSDSDVFYVLVSN